MTIRRRVFIPVFVALSLVVLLTGAAFTTRLLRQADMNDVEEARSAARVAAFVVQESLAALSATCLDYAAWHETREFALGRNSTYATAYLTEEMARKNRLHLIFVFNPRGELVFESGFDPRSGRQIPMREDTRRLLLDRPELSRHEDDKYVSAGVWFLPDGPALIAARPILGDDYQGPVGGSIAFGRYLTRTEFRRLREWIDADFAVVPDTRANNTGGRRGSTAGTVVVTESPDFHLASMPLRHRNGPGARIEVRHPRLARKAHLDEAARGISTILAIGLFVLASTLLAIEYLVTKRLSRLRNFVRDVVRTADLSRRIGARSDSRDEVDELCADFDSLLDKWRSVRAARDATQAALEASNETLRNEVHEREAARRDVAKFAALVEGDGDAIGFFDCGGRLVYLNPAGRRLIGLRADDALDRVCAAGLTGGTDPVKRLPDGETEIRHLRTGEPIPVDVMNIAPRMPDGESIDMNGVVMRDLRPRRQAEAERAHLEEQLHHAQRMDAIGRLAGGVAHDFNNILTAINGYTQLVIETTPESDSRHADLVEIRKSAERAKALTNQLLAFGRRQVVTPRVLSVRESVDSALRMIVRIIGERISLRVDAGEEDGRVLADPMQIDQILVNLVVNARDAMPDGGELAIRVEEERIGDDGDARAYDAEPGSYVRVSVIDTGSGIEPDVLPHVFEPFFTTKEKGKGTGLGLPTVYGIVRQIGGFVTVESQPGKGSAFHIHLPCAQAPVATLDPKTDAERAWGVGTVLLAEDEDAVREYAMRVLTSMGYRVISASCGQDALEKARECGDELALLVTDVIMPRMNGRDLADRLRAERPNLPIVFISGYTDDVLDTQGVFETGARFLQKPFDIDDLVRAVRDAVVEIAA